MKPCVTRVFNNLKAVGFAKLVLVEIVSRLNGNSDWAMVSNINKTFSAMLDLADSSNISEGGVMRDSFSDIYRGFLNIFAFLSVYP
jgi:hypothetical protein